MHLRSGIRPLINTHAVSIVAVLVLVFALMIRLIGINQIPGNVNPDEADTIRTYMEKSQRPWWPNIISTNWNGAPAINMYLIGWSWQVGGESLAAIKTASIVFSSLSILIFYLAVWRLTKSTWLAAGTSLLLASDPLYMHFSRSGWENIFLAIPITATLYFLAKSPTSPKLRWRRAAGLILIATVGLYLYHPGKILFVVNLFFGVVELLRFWWAKKSWRSTTRSLSVLLIALIISTPFFYSFLGPYRTATLGRINNVSVFAYDDVPQTLIINSKRVLSGFTIFRGNTFAVGLNDRYSDTSQNLMLPILAVLYLLGFIFAIRYRPVVALWFLLLLLPVQIFSTNSPDIARSIHLWPIMYWFMALAIWKLGSIFLKYKRISCGLKIIAIMLVWALVYIQLNHYFSWMGSRRALKSREPAIWAFEYRSWVTEMRKSVAESGFTYGVYDWKAKTGQPMP